MVGLVGFLAAGCGSAPKKAKPVNWDMKLTKVTPASIEVDLIGISKSEDSYWRNLRPDDYWKPNSPVRKQVEKRAKTTKFEASPEFVLPKDDPIWNAWFGYGSVELVVMANLPGKFGNDPADPRRLVLPLDKKQWLAKDKTIELEVSDVQVRALTPQKP
jgi:hypothetical protein